MMHTYKYKVPRDNWFWIVAVIVLLSFTAYILLKVVSAGNFNWLAFLFISIYLIVGISLLRVCFIREQYRKIDSKKTITIDTAKREITIIEDEKEIIINQSDIDTVEIYESWNMKPPFMNLGYVKFNLKNGAHFIITQFVADALKLQPLITGKPTKRVTRFMNTIK